MKTRRLSLHGAEMLPVRRLTGAICRDRPRRRPRGTEVSSSRRPQATGCDKTISSSSRQVARPAREDQQMVRPRAVPRRCVLPSRRDLRPIKSIP
jgi:hypothetical protein